MLFLNQRKIQYNIKQNFELFLHILLKFEIIWRIGQVIEFWNAIKISSFFFLSVYLNISASLLPAVIIHDRFYLRL